MAEERIYPEQGIHLHRQQTSTATHTHSPYEGIGDGHSRRVTESHDIHEQARKRQVRGNSRAPHATRTRARTWSPLGLLLFMVVWYGDVWPCDAGDSNGFSSPRVGWPLQKQSPTCLGDKRQQAEMDGERSKRVATSDGNITPILGQTQKIASAHMSHSKPVKSQ